MGLFDGQGPKAALPNGLNMDPQARILIANFRIYDQLDGPLQRFDPRTGDHETLLTEVNGRRLTSSNYPVMTADGCIWCANSTDAETWPQALDGRADGFLFVLRPRLSFDHGGKWMAMLRLRRRNRGAWTRPLLHERHHGGQ